MAVIQIWGKLGYIYIYCLFKVGGGAGAEMWWFIPYPYFRIYIPLLTFSNS